MCFVCVCGCLCLYVSVCVCVREKMSFHCSTFIGNDDGRGGGILSTAYLPLSFSGDSTFSQNRGRALVVSVYYVVCA